ncbi:hypothetical protein R3X26_18840 [Vibrio sp. TH_r3]|uniref:hypothetical protein n=1 Tax=Vibrio sp. TH_r3 TaxID=3082084 RepID=UPI002953AC1F|nr:hypothetical protein [Vibrio sp. TH_r3]MDV7106434.1 hypothetical protein [Vibrio sp. TH_r3]
MLSLTKDQKKLLKWMNEGHTFKVYSDYSPRKGDITPLSKLPVRLFDKSIYKLYRLGLITYEPVSDFGQRWDEFSLTRKGKEVVCKIA